MSAFKVGQRVRVIAADPKSGGAKLGVVGREATITAIPSRLEHLVGGDCDIDADGLGFFVTVFRHLAPLTDPKESEWADAMVKRVTKLEPQKVTPWVTA